MKKKTTEEFINDAIKIHGEKYDYSKVEYQWCDKKVCIICDEHGEFFQTPSHHLHGQGCPKCKNKKISNKLRSNTDIFIKKARNVHNEKYDYSKVNYEKDSIKVCIICPIHGEFWQTPNAHLRGQGCPKCGNITISKKQLFTNFEFIQKAKKIHCDKYDYSKVKYVNTKRKVCIICPKHGEFWQTPDGHLRGHGCNKCGRLANAKKRSGDRLKFIEMSQQIHKFKYDYSKVKYINNHTKVCIICPIHGEFWMMPNNHTHKKSPQGCPKCKSSHLETEVRNFLSENHINFEEQKKFEWMGRQSLDFYLSDYNVAIECQGKQHFESVDHFGGMKNFEYFQERDKRKYELCKSEGIKILYYANYYYDFPYKVYTNKEELIKEVIKQ